jgi:DNA-binding response OmpR family regulator
MTKVAIIDDDPMMVSLLDTLLTLEGFEVQVWDGSPNFLSFLLEGLPSIALIDINLKGYNGLDVLDIIRSNDALSPMGVIMSSGMDYSNECQERGADDFLMKPYMPEDLIDRIRSLSAS